MNILYDYQIFSRQQYGGISRYFFELITRVATEHKVSLCMGLHKNKYGLERHRSTMASYLGIKHADIPYSFRARRFLNQMLLRQFARSVSPDVYHPTYYDDTHRLGRRRVITIHDMTYERFPQFFRMDDPTPREKRNAALAADGIICISESTRDDVCNLLGVPIDKTAVVYLGNSLRFPAKAVNPIGRPYILYVGKRGGYKNFDTLLRAYARSERLKTEFQLLCFGFEKETSEERRAFASMGVTDKVVFLRGDDELLAQCYAHASVFVYPSLIEGFGIPQLEAMYHGCPVVASDVPPLRETAGDAAVYFDPASSDELGMAIERVLTDDDLRNSLLQKGYARERFFSWERCAKETVAFYQRCLVS